MWQLSNPKIDVDFILFDEAQDANPVVLDVVKNKLVEKSLLEIIIREFIHGEVL